MKINVVSSVLSLGLIVFVLGCSNRECSHQSARPVGAEGDVLGTLHAKNHVIIIESQQGHLLYTIKRSDGQLVAENVSLNELSVRFPDLHKVVEKGVAIDASLVDVNTRTTLDR